MKRSILMLLVFGSVFLVRAAQCPNIIWIFSDDHSYQAIGAYGGRLAPLNPTPNIDRLAREGMRFDRLLRSDESLTEKWRYVEMNSVRAGLCSVPEEFPYLGTPGRY